MRINLSCALGEPLDKKTWSATSYNIANALKKEDCLGDTFSSKPTGFLFFVYYLLEKFYKKISSKAYQGLIGFKMLRYIHAYMCVQKTSRSQNNYTLHFGTFDLPFIKKPKVQKHFLYTDATWDCWSRYSTNMNGHSVDSIARIDEIENLAYKHSDHIFCISEYVRENLEVHYKVPVEKITVVGTGTGIIQPYFGKKTYSNGKILFVAKGRFEDKGGDIVIEAFKMAILKLPHLHLSIVGQNSYTTALKQHPNISTYGFIPVEELQSLFNTHSLFLMPALNEPWGLVYLEAMSCKMPIVGLNRNSFPELSGNGKRGVGINEPDPALLADAIVSVFSNVEWMERVGTEAQNYVLKNFTWEITVKKILDQVERLNTENSI